MHRIRFLSALIGSLLLATLSLTSAAQTVAGYNVTFAGRTYVDAADQTTFIYVVTGTGVDPALSHFDVEIPTCDVPLTVVATSPSEAVELGVDPTTGIDGIKWDLPLGTTESRTYSITFAGNVVAGDVQVAVKGGNGFETATVPGPSCTTAELTLDKFVSVDGGATFTDADLSPGPQADLDAEVYFRFVVTNTGTVPLTNLTLSDNLFDLSVCTVPDVLEPDAFFECAIGPVPSVEGQHTNTATATAMFEDITITATDSANYFGGEVPALDVQKFVSIDGVWTAATTAPGPEVDPGDEVSFRFVVTNSGTVELTNFTLTDDTVDTSSCALPPTLASGEGAECVIGPVPAVEGQHTNTVTVTATDPTGETTVEATATANYFGGELDDDDDDDLEITIIIVGPVESIDVNVIVIYGISIELDPNDPLLTVIQIGDVVNIEGIWADDDDDNMTLVIIAITVIIIDVDIYIVDDQVWRDEGECANPPPAWAPAVGWRAKCEGGPSPGRGPDRDDDDDDDDDDD